MTGYRFDGVRILLSEKEWEERLTPEQFRVLRRKGTEAPFCNAYFDWKREGIYVCAGCGLPLFSATVKYDSGTGWPSFWEPLFPENITYEEDSSLFSKRVEVLCSRCEGHLGHVFEDGPPPSGKRYCMNSVALRIVEDV